MEAPRDISVERERLMDEFRAYGGTFTEFSHRFASWLGLHSTDATALMEITAAEEKGGTPLSPARLGERISLTSGATTALLNRLEKAGHIVRTRENADRRVVTLHSSAHVQDLADEFFGPPLAVRLDAMMRSTRPNCSVDSRNFSSTFTRR